MQQNSDDHRFLYFSSLNNSICTYKMHSFYKMCHFGFCGFTFSTFFSPPEAFNNLFHHYLLHKMAVTSSHTSATPTVTMCFHHIRSDLTSSSERLYQEVPVGKRAQCILCLLNIQVNIQPFRMLSFTFCYNSLHHLAPFFSLCKLFTTIYTIQA